MSLKNTSEKFFSMLSLNNKKIKIRWKVLASLLCFAFIIILILWLCQSVFLSDIYKSVKLKELYSSADKLEDEINSRDLQTTANNLSVKNDLCILIIDSNGRQLVSAEALSGCVIHNISYRDHAKLYLKAQENNNECLEYFRYNQQNSSFYSVNEDEMSNEQECIILTRIVENEKGYINIIFVNSVLTPVKSTVRTLNIILSFVSLGLIIISVFLSLIISNSITKPLTKLNKSAKRLANEDYGEIVCGPACKEISELSDSLNFAAGELKKSEELKRELISNISHDLRTPLTMIKGYGEVMRDIPSEMTPENLKIIIEETDRLSSLVSDILDISKLQSGNMKFEPEEFCFTDELISTVGRINGMLENQGYKINLSFETKLNAYADKKRILQVVYNLINNAVTHTGEDKNVYVKQIKVFHENKPYIRLEVSDTGKGIEKEQLPLIWDRYYKVDKFHKRAEMGSGLGLSIVKNIITTHNGYYGVFSEENNGSTFWFEISSL